MNTAQLHEEIKEANLSYMLLARRMIHEGSAMCAVFAAHHFVPGKPIKNGHSSGIASHAIYYGT